MDSRAHHLQPFQRKLEYFKSQLKQAQSQHLLWSELQSTLSFNYQLRRALKSIVTATVALLPTSDASIVLWDPQIETFFTSASTVPGQEERSTSLRVRKRGGVTHYIITTKKTFTVSDVQHDPFGANKMLTEYNFHAYIGVPLVVNNVCIGVLYGLDRSPREYTKEEIQFLEAIADHSAREIRLTLSENHVYNQIAILDQLVEKQTTLVIEAQEKSQALDQLKTKLIQDLSHELRTPITIIELYAELLEKGSHTQQERYINSIQNAAERLSALVDSVLSLQQLPQLADPSQLEYVQFNEIIRQAVNRYRPLAEKKGLTLNAWLDDKTNPSIYGNADQLLEMVSVLLNNSLAYTQMGGITLRTGINLLKDEVELIVQDTGKGIPETDLDIIFDPFFRSDNVSQSTFPGAGVGLSTVKHIVDLHNGQIEVTSNLNEGSQFNLCFPSASAHDGKSTNESN